MADEPPGCTTTACDGSCPADKIVTYSTASGCTGGSVKRRCCSPSSYPDVLVMVDKGAGQPLPKRVYANYPKMQYADYTLLETTWSNVKTVKALPGGFQLALHWPLVTTVADAAAASRTGLTEQLNAEQQPQTGSSRNSSRAAGPACSLFPFGCGKLVQLMPSLTVCQLQL